MKKVTLFLLTAVAWLSCGKHSSTPSPIPKGNRQAAIHITQAQNNSYDVEIARVQSLDIDIVPVTFAWNQVETDTGFDFSLVNLANSYYPGKNMAISLNLSPIYAISSALPSELQSRAFDDPIVISRFEAFLDSIHARLGATQINDVILGLEVDDYLSSHGSAWAAYNVLYDSALVHVKQLWGTDMRVGVETSWSAAVSTAKDSILRLNQQSDMMVLSYYPLQNNFTIRAPTVVQGDIANILGLYPNIPLFIVETGYQTSPVCNSSDELQRQFIANLFTTWDAYADRISFIGFLWLTDLSDSVVAQDVSAYGVSGPYLNAFEAYLQTTGLRTYPGAGTDKPGFTQLKSELAVRGW